MTTVTISHDGFARQSVIRRVVHTKAPCPFCGQNPQGHLFQYGIHSDGFGSRESWERGAFCSKPCRDAFHGQ